MSNHPDDNDDHNEQQNDAADPRRHERHFLRSWLKANVAALAGEVFLA